MESDFSLLFIGTPGAFAAIPLNLIRKKYHLAGIVESAPRGFDSKNLFHQVNLWLNRWFAPHSLWRSALQSGIPFYFYDPQQPENFTRFLKTAAPDLGVIASMNQLLPASLLTIPRLGFINLHPSLLPDLRGPHVWTWLYYYDLKVSGVSVHQVDPGEDSGPILKQAEFPIFSEMPPQRLVDTATRLGADLLLDAIEDIRCDRAFPTPQIPPARPLRHARRIKKGEQLLNHQTWSLEHTYHFLQGSRPWYSPFSEAQRLWGWIDWIPTHYSTDHISPNKVGKISLGKTGFYLGHTAGKIHLKLKINLIRTVLLVLLLLGLFNLFAMAK